jgi:site-specific DNA-cytosine methylase
MQKPVVIDLFAGGGGASEGIKRALGVSPVLAINHCPAAIAMHCANHPESLHMCEDVFKILPHKPVKRKGIDLLWASPDCTDHSRAKGGKPRELARAQGFGEDYILTGTKRAQVARIGNSVCPPVARAIVEAQFGVNAARVAA